MPDPLAGQADPEAPAQDAPATDEPDIEAVTARYEERIRGFQKLLSKRDEDHEKALADVMRKVEELQDATLSDDERAKVRSKRESDELARLRAENALLRLGATKPKAVDFFQKLTSAKTAEEQIDILDALLTPAKPEEEESAKVDANNPIRPPVSAPQGMDEAKAERVLKATPRWR